MQDLKKLRSKIDSIDKKILAALSERAKVSKAIGRVKRAAKAPALDAKRWAAVVRSRTAFGKSKGLKPAFVKKLLEVIHKDSLSRQK